MEDRRWSAKNNKKHLKSSRVDLWSVVSGLYPARIGSMRFRPMAGLVGCFFYFILACTCFWPQINKVCLFLAAALLHNMQQVRAQRTAVYWISTYCGPTTCSHTAVMLQFYHNTYVEYICICTRITRTYQTCCRILFLSYKPRVGLG